MQGAQAHHHLRHLYQKQAHQHLLQAALLRDPLQLQHCCLAPLGEPALLEVLWSLLLQYHQCPTSLQPLHPTAVLKIERDVKEPQWWVTAVAVCVGAVPSPHG